LFFIMLKIDINIAPWIAGCCDTATKDNCLFYIFVLLAYFYHVSHILLLSWEYSSGIQEILAVLSHHIYYTRILLPFLKSSRHP